MRPVGILGGMGPEATILLMQKVLAAVPAHDDADHVPLIVHQNPQVPSRIKALIDGTGDDPGPVLAQMARDLEHAGAQALAMPCNTAHHYSRAVTDASKLPFLDMLAVTARHIQNEGAHRVGMLASPATRMVDVFTPAFAPRGLSQVWLQDDAPLLAVIRSVKAGESTATLKPKLASLAQSLLDEGADHLLIACTELSLLNDAMPAQAAWSDSLDCLTDTLVKFSKA